MIKEITIDMAKDISEKTQFPEVIIVGYDPITNKQHVTTYGKTKDQSLDAARAGNFIKKACGWPDELCHEIPDKKILDEKNL